MSLLNGFNGQLGGRPAARPTNEQPQGTNGQPNWPQPAQQQPSAAAQAAQAAAAHWAQQPAQPGYAPQGYGQPYGTAPQPQQAYGQQHAAPASPYSGLASQSDPYAPSFEPYVAPASAASQRPAQQSYQQAQAAQGYQPQAQPQPAQAYGHQAYGAPEPRTQVPQQPVHQYAAHQQQVPQPQQWGAQPANPRGYDANGYPQQPSAQAAYRGNDPRLHEAEPAISDWSNAHQGAQGYELGDAHGGHNDMGFAQAAGGELEQGYADDDGQEYEVEEAPRSKRPLMIAAALAGAIFVGGGMSYGYKAFTGGSASGNPPMIKSAVEPSKTKPADAGGKQFAHTDSKILGRLGEGASPAGAAVTGAGGEMDANGTRKVSTLVVGRDGSIQAPAASPVEEVVAAAAPNVTAPQSPTVSVPGMMVVDAMGPKSKSVASTLAAGAAEAVQAPQKLVVTPPAAPQKPVTIAKAAAADAQRVLPEATGSIEPPVAAAPVKKPAAKKVAAAEPTIANDAAPVASGGTSGYVAVLASVPRSTSSRMDALKRFADMQQKYGSVLSGKTPDVAEANLGAKGAYHRLVVGPPASREQASTLCSQLKAQGYADCWVTSY